VILAADAGAEVKVSLVWGPNPGDRQTIPIKPLRTEYAKFPLSFTAGADTDDAAGNVGTGKGTFHIGAVSLMPADNLNGYRADLIAEMKKIGPTMFRWPVEYGLLVGLAGFHRRSRQTAPRLNPAWAKCSRTTWGSTTTWSSTSCSTWSRTFA